MDAIALSDDDDDFAPASQLSQSSLLEGLDRRLQEWCALASQPSSTSSRKRKWSTADDDDQPAARTDRAQKVLDKKADAARKKEEKQRLKEAERAAKAAEKEKAKLTNAVNKLVTDKKDTLPDMFVEMCFALQASLQFKPIAHHLQSMIAQKSGHPVAKDWPIRVVDDLDPPNMLCWRRRVTARYDEITRRFLPLDQSQIVLENARLLYLQKEHLQIGMKNGRFEQTVQRLREEVGPKGLLFAMIDGGSRAKDVERQLTMMMMKHRLNIIRVDGPLDAATWLYDMTADLGYKPHRLLEKSHLPNIGDTNLDTGANARDTWYKMLLQVFRMTESAAQGIMQQYPTFYSLLSAYEASGWEGEHLLKEILILKRRDGMDRQQLRLGPKLSNRVWRSLTSTNPDELLADFGRADADLDDDDG